MAGCGQVLDGLGYLCTDQSEIDSGGTGNHVCWLFYMEAEGPLKSMYLWLVIFIFYFLNSARDDHPKGSVTDPQEQINYYSGLPLSPGEGTIFGRLFSGRRLVMCAFCKRMLETLVEYTLYRG